MPIKQYKVRLYCRDEALRGYRARLLSVCEGERVRERAYLSERVRLDLWEVRGRERSGGDAVGVAQGAGSVVSALISFSRAGARRDAGVEEGQVRDGKV